MRKIVYTALIPVVIALFSGCEPEDGRATVRGIITNGKTPISQVKVDLDGVLNYQTFTDQQGRFEIQNVSPGTHQLNILQSRSDSSFSSRSSTISVSQDLNLNQILLPEPVQFSAPLIVQEFDKNHVKLQWSKYSAEDFREYKLYASNTPGLDEKTGDLIYVTTNPDDTTFTLSMPNSTLRYFRVFVLSETSLLGGSNLVTAYTNGYVNNPVVVLATEQKYYLNEGETLWLNFKAIKGEIYHITWFDRSLSDSHPNLGDYTTVVYVGAYHSDKVTAYFDDMRLIPMTTAPQVIGALETEDIYLKVQGYDIYSKGSFAIRIDKVNKAMAPKVEVDGPTVNVPVGLGAMQVLYFDAEGGQKYKITSLSEKDNRAAYDDFIHMKISAFSGSENNPYFYQDYLGIYGSPPWEHTITAAATDKVYLVVQGSFWNKPNAAIIGVKKN